MKYRNIQNAFSLMEMMVVLLIVSIIAAATAPMVTKKMARSAGSGDSPWVFTGLSNNIAYNMNGSDNTTAIIGATSLPQGWTKHTRLFIDSGDNASHIAFGNGNTEPLLLTADPTLGRIGFSNAEIPNSSIAFGTRQTIDKDSTGLILIGNQAKAGGLKDSSRGNNAIAIGIEAQALDVNSIAIGNKAQAMNSGARDDSNKAVYGNNIAIGHSAESKDYCTIAIGNEAGTNDSGTSQSSDYAIAIGNKAKARANRSIAIGNKANVAYAHTNSIAIGNGVETSDSDQIVLGTASDTVYIRGNLVALGNVVLGSSGKSCIVYAPDNGSYGILRKYNGNNGKTWYSYPEGSTLNINGTSYSYWSDRRLKNVGEKYTAGLEELKKLDFYHYTFKDDKENTPLVGVIAQDLQKVFPDAVTKGEDGYLRIRLEDMFYAVINAVKELDNKISQIVANVSGLSTKVDEQQKVIDEQAQKIETLEKQNIELMDEIKDIEKQIKKMKK